MPIVNYRRGQKGQDNPYAAPVNIGEIDTPDYGQGPTLEYEAASEPYSSSYTGWSPTLDVSADGTPDSERLGQRPIIGFRGNPDRLPQYYRRLDADTARRSSVEKIDADGYQERKGTVAGDTRFQPNPRSINVAESRPTQQMAPRSYLFWRPFGPGAGGVPKASARHFTGEHFSMANHKRTSEIFGMAPRRSWRNTYRLTPEPWDEDIIDIPQDQDVSPDAVLVSPDAVSLDRGRSYRL